ncbi:hypothetical protein [Streptomyces sp. NBC_01794]|uniref:hypothetical protein n=1 Tax=Streptomyces sp. NBC_01794 TaxID=2975942 RepID=UPI0030906B73|nr:hypothetical protein OIE54_33890 [Streptomyces sp. NBC_01794]
MHRSFARRRVLGAAAAVAGAALLAPWEGAARAAESTGTRRPAHFLLPNGFQPEGITIGASPYACFGSPATGDIYRASLANGRGSVISHGLGEDHPAVGLKIDRSERLLFVCGGVSREIFDVEPTPSTSYDAVAVDQV